MSTIDLFNDVPAFVAVVEAGSFAAAAHRLHLSRSAVGKAVARLEDRLDVRLFQRTTRSKRLTDDGQAFFEHCQQAIGALQAGKARLDTGKKTVSGTLRITMPVLFGRLCSAPTMMRLAAANPHLSLELDFRDHHVDVIDAGIDLAIRNGPVGISTGLVARCIARNRSIICAAASYIERRGLPETLDDLARHDAILYSRDGNDQVWQFVHHNRPPTQLIPPARLRFSDLGALLDAVIAGDGMAWLPEWLVTEHLAKHELIEILPDVASRLEEIHLIWPSAPHLPARVRAAIEVLSNEIANAEWSVVAAPVFSEGQ